METLRSLIEKHPEWADLPVTVSVWGSSGDIAYITLDGSDGGVDVFVDDDGTKCLYFGASIV